MRKKDATQCHAITLISQAISGTMMNLDEDDWNVPAADSKGHSTKLTTRVPPAMARAIEQLVQSGRFPFSTSDDFQRFCIRLGLLIMDHVSGGFLTTQSAAEAIIRVVRDIENRQMIQVAVEMAADACEKMMADLDVASLAANVAYIDHVIAKIPETSQWRRQFEERWREASKEYREFICSHGKCE